jgi:hypothetical protein
MHACVHTYAFIYNTYCVYCIIYMYIFVCVCVCVCVCVRACVFVCVFIYMHTYMHTCIHAYMHTYIILYRCMNGDIRSHLYEFITHTHTHTHTHTLCVPVIASENLEKVRVGFGLHFSPRHFHVSVSLSCKAAVK